MSRNKEDHVEKVEAVVIGGGVIGAAILYVLSAIGIDAVLFEKQSKCGTQTSEHNSETVHGLFGYDPIHWLKVILAVIGAVQLERYSNSRGVPFSVPGKIVVATSEAELPVLAKLEKQAQRSGARGVRLLRPGELQVIEPNVRGFGGILSPHTGVVDSGRLVRTLLADAERNGAAFITNAEVIGGAVNDNGMIVRIAEGVGEARQETRVQAKYVINAAGLWAQNIAANLGVSAQAIPEGFYAKGNYFEYYLTGGEKSHPERPRMPFNHLIYPAPAPAPVKGGTRGLGIHSVESIESLKGGVSDTLIFGPDVQWLDIMDLNHPDFFAGEERLELFGKAIAQFWPKVDVTRLRPGQAGIRPKLSGEGQPAVDFRIDNHRVHGIPGLINLFGIESPGLTACLAIALHVLQLLGLKSDEEILKM